MSGKESKIPETKLKFERAFFNKMMWHETTEEEVKRVFYCNPAGYNRILSGEEVASPRGTGVIYRLIPKGDYKNELQTPDPTPKNRPWNTKI